MLIRFVVSNFLSFNEETEFNMLAASYDTHKHHVYQTGKLNVLKAAAMYGANGAGKSNFVKAIAFFKEMVETGRVNTLPRSKKFKLKKENADLPIEFEIEFTYKKNIYVYGFSINKNIVEKEFLYLSGIDKDDELIFERETQKNNLSKIKMADRFLKTEKEKLLIEVMAENFLKNNELFLGKSENLKNVFINDVRLWIVFNLVIIYPHTNLSTVLLGTVNNIVNIDIANRLLRTFKTGVEKLGVEIIDIDVYFGDDEDEKNKLLEDLVYRNITFFSFNGDKILAIKENDKVVIKRLVTVHQNSNNENINFELWEESDGTQRLLDFMPVFYSIINEDSTIIIDEIDQSLHPVLLYTLVEKIMAEKNTKGQLLFTTDDANLLDLDVFRQDEIWFAEKNKKGETQLYSLSDYKPIKEDLDARKGYLMGRFGAIPFTKDLKNLKYLQKKK